MILKEYKIGEGFLYKIVQCTNEVINISNNLEFRTIKLTENAELVATMFKWFT